jgi:hypothetical protein
MIDIAVLALVALQLFAADLADIRNDPNLEKRAQSALLFADSSFEQAKTAYAAGELDKAAQALKDMQAGVETARDALESTHKNPRKHVGPFKKAETETRGLLRRLDGLENTMDFDDRKIIEGPKAKVQEVHDEWLTAIISGKH